MKIVAIYSNGGSGKTITLNMFIKKVLFAYSHKIKIITTSLIGNSIGDYLDDTLNPNDRDHYIVFQIDGKRIGITTVGDNRRCLETDFKNFDKCKLCFCAARSNGDTHRFLKNKSNAEVFVCYKQTRIDSYPIINLESRWQLANESMAELLIKEIIEFIEL